MAYEYERIIKKELEYTDLSNAEDQSEMLKEIKEVYRKAKAFDEVKKFVDEQGDSYMDIYRQTKDPIFSLLNSNYDNLLGFIEEMEDK